MKWSFESLLFFICSLFFDFWDDGIGFLVASSPCFYLLSLLLTWLFGGGACLDVAGVRLAPYQWSLGWLGLILGLGWDAFCFGFSRRNLVVVRGDCTLKQSKDLTKIKPFLPYLSELWQTHRLLIMLFYCRTIWQNWGIASLILLILHISGRCTLYRIFTSHTIANLHLHLDYLLHHNEDKLCLPEEYLSTNDKHIGAQNMLEPPESKRWQVMNGIVVVVDVRKRIHTELRHFARAFEIRLQLN